MNFETALSVLVYAAVILALLGLTIVGIRELKDWLAGRRKK